jgi:hypothetical protein
MAAPLIVIQALHQSRPERISVDVLERLHQIVVCIDQNGFISPPEKVTVATEANFFIWLSTSFKYLYFLSIAKLGSGSIAI